MRLVIEDAAGTRSVVPLASDEITLGRARDGNTFRLEDRNVSRRHARVVPASGAVFIEDLGSLNGTRVNGERITGRRRLREGDLVEIGDYDLALLPEEDRPGAPPALRPTPAPGTAASGAAAPGPPAPAPGTAAPGAAAPGPPAPQVPPPAAVAPAMPAIAAVTAAAPPPGHAPSPPVAAPAAAPTAGPSPPAAPSAPASPSPLGRALRAGAVALALGFGAGWAVGMLTAPEPAPPGEATSPR